MSKSGSFIERDLAGVCGRSPDLDAAITKDSGSSIFITALSSSIPPAAVRGAKSPDGVTFGSDVCSGVAPGPGFDKLERFLNSFMILRSTTPRMMCAVIGCAVAASGWQSAAAQTSSRPAPMNVVFILADDLGWSDTSLFGTTRLYQTPNLERLAKRGMLFSRAYAASPLCSPTRASILTGQNPARIGITAPNLSPARGETEGVSSGEGAA